MPEQTVVPAASPVVEDDGDAVLTRILDAAAEQFARHGVRRTSMDDVARRARVGRNTVFRRLGSKDELVRAVLGRELQRLFADLELVVAAESDPLERVAGVFVTTVGAIRAHPMIRGALAEHPDEVAELSVFASGELMGLSTIYLTGVLEAEAARGSLPAGFQVDVVAETVVRLVHSVVLVPHLARPLESANDLRAFAVAVLRPHLES